MDLVTISQIANPILQTLFIAVIGLGYYFTVRATWATVAEMRAEHTAGGGRPLITVSEDYANLPTQPAPLSFHVVVLHKVSGRRISLSLIRCLDFSE